MSQSYPVYPRSSFPEEIDAFQYMQDIDETLLTAATAYNTYINQGNLEAAEKVRESTPELDKCLFNADKHNKLLDAVMAIETMFRDDIHTFIRDIVKYCGLYSKNKQYKKYNVVDYIIEDISNPFIAIQDVPIGIMPTDSSYWKPLAIKGDQGISGIGLSPRGRWNSTVTYYKDDLVSHNLKWYVATESVSVGEEPSDNTAGWEIFFDLTALVKGSFDAINNRIDSHTSSIVSGSNGAHGLRYDEPANLLMRQTAQGGWVEIETGGGFVIQSSAPGKTNVLWIDTSMGNDTGVMKYYNGASWTPITPTWK